MGRFTVAFLILLSTAGVCAIVAGLNLINMPRSSHKTDPVPVFVVGAIIAILVACYVY